MKNKKLFYNKLAKGLASFVTIIVLLSSILATSFFYENRITANVIREDSSNWESAAVAVTEVDDINGLSQLNEGWYEVRKGFVFYLDTFNSYVPLYIRIANIEYQDGLMAVDGDGNVEFSYRVNEGDGRVVADEEKEDTETNNNEVTAAAIRDITGDVTGGQTVTKANIFQRWWCSCTYYLGNTPLKEKDKFWDSKGNEYTVGLFSITMLEKNSKVPVPVDDVSKLPANDFYASNPAPKETASLQEATRGDDGRWRLPDGTDVIDVLYAAIPTTTPTATDAGGVAAVFARNSVVYDKFNVEYRVQTPPSDAVTLRKSDGSVVNNPNPNDYYAQKLPRDGNSILQIGSKIAKTEDNKPEVYELVRAEDGTVVYKANQADNPFNPVAAGKTLALPNRQESTDISFFEAGVVMLQKQSTVIGIPQLPAVQEKSANNYPEPTDITQKQNAIKASELNALYNLFGSGQTPPLLHVKFETKWNPAGYYETTATYTGDDPKFQQFKEKTGTGYGITQKLGDKIPAPPTPQVPAPTIEEWKKQIDDEPQWDENKLKQNIGDFYFDKDGYIWAGDLAGAFIVGKANNELLGKYKDSTIQVDREGKIIRPSVSVTLTPLSQPQQTEKSTQQLTEMRYTAPSPTDANKIKYNTDKSLDTLASRLQNIGYPPEQIRKIYDGDTEAIARAQAFLGFTGKDIDGLAGDNTLARAGALLDKIIEEKKNRGLPEEGQNPFEVKSKDGKAVIFNPVENTGLVEIGKDDKGDTVYDVYKGDAAKFNIAFRLTERELPTPAQSGMSVTQSSSQPVQQVQLSDGTKKIDYGTQLVGDKIIDEFIPIVSQDYNIIKTGNEFYLVTNKNPNIGYEAKALKISSKEVMLYSEKYPEQFVIVPLADVPTGISVTEIAALLISIQASPAPTPAPVAPPAPAASQPSPSTLKVGDTLSNFDKLTTLTPEKSKLPSGVSSPGATPGTPDFKGITHKVDLGDGNFRVVIVPEKDQTGNQYVQTVITDKDGKITKVEISQSIDPRLTSSADFKKWDGASLDYIPTSKGFIQISIKGDVQTSIDNIVVTDPATKKPIITEKTITAISPTLTIVEKSKTAYFYDGREITKAEYDRLKKEGKDAKEEKNFITYKLEDVMIDDRKYVVTYTFDTIFDETKSPVRVYEATRVNQNTGQIEEFRYGEGNQIINIHTPGGVGIMDLSVLQKLLSRQELVIEGDPKLKDKAITRLNQYISRQFFASVERVLTEFQGLGYYSTLFFDEDSLLQWRDNVDRAFATLYLGTEYWTSSICGSYLDGEDEGIAYAETPQGYSQVGAHIEATRSEPLITPTGVEFLYKITFNIRNGDYDNDPRAPEQMNYNVVLKGERTVSVFKQAQTVERGSSSGRAGRSAIVKYSTALYTEVCLQFDKIPLRWKLDNGELCNTIVSGGGEATPVASSSTSAPSSGSSGAGEFNDF